jgi:hypothetical protein
VILPITLLPRLANHSAPSGPFVIPNGMELFGSVWLVTTPAVVMRPIELYVWLVNHKAPSGPAVIPLGPEMLGSV